MKREYTVKQVAGILNAGRSTVNKWIVEGSLDAYQLPGGGYKITKEQLVGFMTKYNIPLDYIEGYMKKRVLVIDDDDTILGVLKSFFKKQGFDVYTTSSGFETGLFLERHRPHLIILDIKLKGIDGREICKEIKSNPEYSEMKIIGISGHVTAARKEMLEHGFDGFLRKPFDLEELKNKFSELL